MKECNKCKQVLALDMFYKCKSFKDGLQYQCKQCNKLDSKQRRLDNPEYMKQWHNNNPEYKKQYDKQWRLENIEQHRQYMKQYIKQYNTQLPPGVYMIKCLVNGKKYVGESKVPIARRTQHFQNCKTAKSLKTTNASLQADIKLYGSDNFIFEIIEHCEPELLKQRETYYINLYKPEYNLTT